eukprot:CAMPEP_0185567098 /NCGR_PEP_ID=MMETSP0434-20130131/473_1 /TAXON_ID=626734 ORGANISM="Favella taraikaensis, Strain Fe Narragansett Bay" /NCGR_SAMPLE_ID=MMETSP0434 /ASSEMBLY_ACC=CAM_ASM_000379 /LENGTH=35 /DNA_ID= /DNA_START= /DNA_END= /DNA_ORIENTATION=
MLNQGASLRVDGSTKDEDVLAQFAARARSKISTQP